MLPKIMGILGGIVVLTSIFVGGLVLAAWHVQPAPRQTSSAGVAAIQLKAAKSVQERLKTMSSGRTLAVKFFRGPDHLLGVVGVNKMTGKRFIAWASPNGKALIIGPVIADGRNLTSYYQTFYLGTPGNPVIRKGAATLEGQADSEGQPQPSRQSPTPHGSGSPNQDQRVKPAVMAYIRKDKHVITLGKGPKHLYLFVDTYCGFCAQAIRRLQAPIEAGLVRVTFIPVAALGADSRDAGASLLLAANPGKALTQPGSTLLQRPRTSEAVHNVLLNTSLLSKVAPAVATPTFVYRDANTGMATYRQGLPERMDSLLAKIKRGKHDLPE